MTEAAVYGYQPLGGGWNSPGITTDLQITEISSLEEVAAVEGGLHDTTFPSLPNLHPPQALYLNLWEFPQARVGNSTAIPVVQ